MSSTKKPKKNEEIAPKQKPSAKPAPKEKILGIDDRELEELLERYRRESKKSKANPSGK